LLTVTVWAALVAPGTTNPKVKAVGLTFRPDATCAVPLKATLTAATPGDDEEMVSVAALPPVVAGLKTI
jgi:hypothetical protein